MSADKARRIARSMRPGAVSMSALLVLGFTLASLPAFSQGTMAPGGGATAPQPRVAPALQAPVVAPQAPVAVVPIPSVKQPGPAGGPQKIINNSEKDAAKVEAQYSRVTGTVTTSATGARAVKADARGALPLGVLQPGAHRVAINVKDLLTPQKTPGGSGPVTPEPAGILISLLLPAVQKVGEAPTTVTVERAFPRSFFANSTEARIEIIVLQGGGNAKVNWGDKSPAVDVVQDGSATRLRISADVSTIRVQNY